MQDTSFFRDKFVVEVEACKKSVVTKQQVVHF